MHLKRYTRFLFPRKQLLLVYGDNPCFTDGTDRLQGGQVEIAKTISIDEGIGTIIGQAGEYDGVIIGDIPSEKRNELMKRCYAGNIRSYTVPKISDILLRTSVELNIFDSPLYLSRNIEGLPWDQQVLKRFEDILISGLMLIVTSRSS